MSFEHRFPLPGWPTRGDAMEAITAIASRVSIPLPAVWHQRLAGDEADDVAEPAPNGFGVASDREVLPNDVTITLVFSVPVSDRERICAVLEPGKSYKGGFEPPRGDIDWGAAEAAGVVETRVEHGRFERRALLVTGTDAERYLRRPAEYTISIELFAADEDEAHPAHLLIHSNANHNREAFPLLALLGEALAAELTALLLLA